MEARMTKGDKTISVGPEKSSPNQHHMPHLPTKEDQKPRRRSERLFGGTNDEGGKTGSPLDLKIQSQTPYATIFTDQTDLLTTY